MAVQTTYSFPVQPADRAVEAMCGVFLHLICWKQLYGIDFISCIRNGANLDVTFSDPIPKAERDAIRMTLA
jgi:hypothetical protein